MSVEAEERDQLVDDIFGAAFDEELGEKPAEEAKPEEKPAEEKPAEEAKPEEKPAEKPVEEPAPDPELLALKAKLVETEKLLEEAKKPKEPEAPVVPEKDEAWEKFEKDWPEHAAVMKKQSGEIADLKKSMSELVDALKAQIEPVAASVADAEQEKFLAPILAKHPDALDLDKNGKLEEWVKKQPTHLRAGYNFVLTQGTPEEIIQVFDAFKESTGAAKPAEPDPEAERLAAEKKAEDEKRLRKMEVPETVRTSVTAEPDPDDFDSAFESEMKKFK